MSEIPDQPTVQVSDIWIGRGRFRRDLGDIESLAQSIKEVGLIHPITVTPDLDLVAGRRRLAAVKSLGWLRVPVYYVDLDMLLAERDENTQRKPFAPSEAVAIAAALEERERKAAEDRQLAGKGQDGSGGRGKKKKPGENFSQGAGRTRAPKAKERVAAAVGLSSPSLTKATMLVNAAIMDAKHADLVKQMDDTGKIHPAYVELKKRQQAEHTAREAKKAKKSKIHRVIEAENMSMIADESVNLIVTDPPYNISWDRVVEFPEDTRKGWSRDIAEWDHHMAEEFAKKMLDWSKEFFRVLKFGGSLYCFCSQAEISTLRTYLIISGFSFKNVLTWYFGNPRPKPDKTSWLNATDNILFAVKNGGHTFNWTDVKDMHSVIAIPICQGKERRDHPTQKPLKLIKKLIAVSSNPGDIVLDPFAGSGTTGEACQKLDRSFILIECVPEYIQIIEERTGVKHEKHN